MRKISTTKLIDFCFQRIIGLLYIEYKFQSVSVFYELFQTFYDDHEADLSVNYDAISSILAISILMSLSNE